ncbi:FAD-dependent oxidoreductase [Neobacillus sp. 114]|uniref:oxidoreductase n=1 Tax=Neobacillus sp. 114 TaxID=3048535 RepID=UPI0024C3147D|nr:FAD-dependent oxidoreductase [Neobacillus sp. 114]
MSLTKETYTHLFSENKIGDINLKNRIIMAPMETNMASSSGEVTSKMIKYYAERAKGGAGAIIVEFTCVEREHGLGSPHQLLIDDDSFISGHRAIAMEIKSHGSKAFLQLHHAGRETRKSVIGRQPLAPSPIPCKVMKESPKELTIEEIKMIEDKFISAAYRAYKAGYDGVELHAAHGYLLNGFLSPYSNKRTDKYGGSLENRGRIIKNVIQGIKKTVDGNFPVIIRFSMDEFIEEGLNIGEGIKFAKFFEDSGASAIHASTGIFESIDRNVEPMSFSEGWRIPMARRVKEAINIPVIGVGVIRDPAFADKIIKNQDIDFVAMGRSFLADPHWAKKAKEGNQDLIIKCTSCCYCAERVTKHAEVRCSVNPVTGREADLLPLVKADKPLRVAVIGGGSAGMVAALTAEEKGHHVTLFEANDKLGGLLDVAAAGVHKEKWAWFFDSLIKRIGYSKVNVQLNKKVSEADLLEMDFDKLIIATGMIPKHDPIKTDHSIPIMDVVEAFRNKETINGKKVVVLGSRGAGLEMSHYLAENNNKVIAISRSGKREIGRNIDPLNRRDIMSHIKFLPIQFLTNTDIDRVENNKLILITNEGETFSINVDLIISARGFKPNDLFINNEYDRIGSCKEPRKILDAVLEGYIAGNSLS